jgi:hypothetical protein
MVRPRSIQHNWALMSLPAERSTMAMRTEALHQLHSTERKPGEGDFVQLCREPARDFRVPYKPLGDRGLCTAKLGRVHGSEEAHDRPQDRQESPGRAGSASSLIEGELFMGLAQYSIVAEGNEWGVLHDGNIKNRYATKESAFEAAVAAASLAIREGHEVHISVPDRFAGNQTALGAKDNEGLSAV